MEIKLNFNPSEVKSDNECFEASRVGGMPFKFWLIYKNCTVTDQYFVDKMDNFIEYCEFMYDEYHDNVQPWTNPDEFYNVISQHCDIRITPEFVIKYWDYFSLNIQKKVTIKYDVIETVEKSEVI